MTKEAKVDFHSNVGRNVTFKHNDYKNGKESQTGKIFGVLKDEEKGAYYQVKGADDREYMVQPSDVSLSESEDEHAHS